MSSSTNVIVLQPSRSRQQMGAEVSEKASNRSNKPAVEAYHIPEQVRRLIACEFRVVKSSRRLARKYKLPQHVVSDILHLDLRHEMTVALARIQRGYAA